mgnify:FL=1
MVLEKIQKENDIKKLTPEELELLKDEIRQFLIESISVTGGHLASNLGVVELTMALHLCFDLPKDKIVWDVGHQSYTHKILTGRKDGFSSLRQYGGMSGFPKADESDCDCFNTGHSSTSISAGLGLATARQVTGEDYHVVSVIGDGALTGGMAYEALNNASSVKGNFIIVLNDNNMSISENVGGISQYLSGFRTADAYRDLKNNVMNSLNHIPIYGERMVKHIRNTKSSIKQLFIPGMFFEEMGIIYLGPVDGSDIKEMCRVFDEAKRVDGPVLVHVLTKKGAGYGPAERYPSRFHGAEPFVIETGLPKNKRTKANYTDVFSTVMKKLGERNPKVVAITAAMADGTGLRRFHRNFPERFFDVGIAEAHATTFAAGLAKSGLIPVFAVYSSFLQRAFDQILHDVCIQNLHVIFAIDRAGLVGADGETHQGCFDLSYLSMMPNMTVLAPKNDRELEEMLAFAVSFDGPIAIRYPRGSAHQGLREYQAPVEYGRSEIIRKGKKIAVLGVGSMIPSCMEICKGLKDDGYDPTFVNARFVKPLDVDLLDELAKDHSLFVTVEENVKSGGYGEHVSAYMEACHPEIRVLSAAVWDRFVPQGNVESLRSRIGLGVEDIRQAIEDSEELREQ